MFLVACLVLGFLNEQVAAFDESNIPFLENFDNIQGVQISTVRYFDTLEKLNFRYIILTNHYINAKNRNLQSELVLFSRVKKLKLEVN